jgi:hypothetical protein
MRSLFLLACTFVLLVTYLESMRHDQPQAVQTLQPIKIIRTPPSTKAVSGSSIAVPEQHTPTLNLSLPPPTDIHQPYQQAKTPLLELFKQPNQPGISYNAELIFDDDKGETITGGKIHIKIPFG